MPALGSTPLLGQKRFNLGHNVLGEYCFQSKAERCWGGNASYTSFVSKERYLSSYSSPETEQVQPCALESNSHLRSLFCCRSNQEHLAEQYQTSCESQLGASGGALQKYLSEHTTLQGAPCFTLLFTHRNCYWNTTASKELWASSYHSWLVTGITPNTLTRLSAPTLFSDLCLEASYFASELQGAGFACRKLPKK